MPGFLGGSTSGGGGVSGEIRFAKEFIDPVTKLRVSQPETLIDTDFEYGLQPTKWETVELINNTPSFFSKSGDTTIPNIASITTNAGTREITVTTALDHGLAVGIPINVTGTKSITADGSYIINSIPNPTTFTYLCKDNQAETLSIEDLYTSIITGEFFQGSQLRIANSEGITTDGDPVSILTVKTESAHGFGVNTPFYFLNLNSTVAQEFEAANTAAKSFDSSNSATAQTFDGSNTLSQIQIDWSNSATIGGTVSTITSVSTASDTITVTHTLESFQNQPLGTPLYYDVTSSAGYFSNNPRGVVFLRSVDNLGSSSSTFTVSQVPNGDVIDIESAVTGTFQLANQARTFAGNNRNPNTEVEINVISEDPILFDGGNQGYVEGTQSNGSCTVLGYTGDTVLVSTDAGAGLDYYTGAMIKYSTTGSAASGLTNNATYFVDSFVATATPDLYTISLKQLPTDASTISASGGTGTQSFTKIGVSIDKNVFHVRNSSYVEGEMLQYIPPSAEGKVITDSSKNFFFVDTAYDQHNYLLSDVVANFVSATGGSVTQIVENGATYNVHTFTATGTSTLTVTNGGVVDVMLVGGGGGGAPNSGGGGGGGSVIVAQVEVAAGTHNVVVGAGGAGGAGDYIDAARGANGGSSTFYGITATGGGGGASYSSFAGSAGANGGGGGDPSGAGGQGVAPTLPAGVTGTVYGGFRGANAIGGGHRAGGGSGAGGNAPVNGSGGPGVVLGFDGDTKFYGGGGGAGNWAWATTGNSGGPGGGGGGGANNFPPGLGGKGGKNLGGNGRQGQDLNPSGGNGGANTGGGGGGGTFYGRNGGRGGSGGSGIVMVKYPVTAPAPTPMSATGGAITTQTINGIIHRVHTFTSGTGSFVVSDPGNIGNTEILVVAGGGGGGWDVGGGGGGGGVCVAKNYQLSAGTYSVSVGNGGAGANVNTNGLRAGNTGANSSFGTIVAQGGGGGGGWRSQLGKAGGSGGGTDSERSDWWNSTQGQAFGYAGLGYNGGRGAGNTSPSANEYAGASGGGGAYGAGGDGYNSNFGANSQYYAYGGAGYPSNITGTTVYYGTGAPGSSDGGSHRGAAATGGAAYQQSGFTNTGGGGGGGGAGGSTPNVGGTGGSGVVIIRYPLSVAGQ